MAAALLLDFVGAHAGVADENDAVVRIIGVDQFHHRRLLDLAASRVSPHRIVDAIVKIKVDEVLELGARRREHLLTDPDVVLHRSADIDEQQQLHGIVPLGHELQIEPAGIVRRRFYGAVEIDGGPRP